MAEKSTFVSLFLTDGVRIIEMILLVIFCFLFGNGHVNC